MSPINSKILLFLGATSILVVLLLGAASYWYLLRLAGEIAGIKLELAATDQRIKNTKALEKVLTVSQEERGRLDGIFVSRDELIHFIEDLEEGAKASEVRLEVEALSSAARSGESASSFRLDVQGSFAAVFKYLLLLENLPYETSFEQMNLEFSEEWRGFYVIKILSYES